MELELVYGVFPSAVVLGDSGVEAETVAPIGFVNELSSSIPGTRNSVGFMAYHIVKRRSTLVWRRKLVIGQFGLLFARQRLSTTEDWIESCVGKCAQDW